MRWTRTRFYCRFLSSTTCSARAYDDDETGTKIAHSRFGPIVVVYFRTRLIFVLYLARPSANTTRLFLFFFLCFTALRSAGRRRLSLTPRYRKSRGHDVPCCDNVYRFLLFITTRTVHSRLIWLLLCCFCVHHKHIF